MARPAVARIPAACRIRRWQGAVGAVRDRSGLRGRGVASTSAIFVAGEEVNDWYIVQL